jgi:hypothetical protein
MKTVTKAELQANRLKVVVHDVNMKTSIKDLQYLIKRRTGITLTPSAIYFGRPYGKSFDDLQ